MGTMVAGTTETARSEYPSRALRPVDRLARRKPNDALDPEGRALVHPFVGRTAELRILERKLESALHGAGSTALLVGDAGIGKTRLADRVCELAAERGGLALWGRCWPDEGAPPYWPWVQILRACIRRPLPPPADAELSWALAEIAHLVPDVRPAVAAAEWSSGELEQMQFRLFDAISSCLGAYARIQPLVLVLDDLHHADDPSLLLLRFIARDLRDVPLLILGTYRVAEVRCSPRLTTAFAALSREAERLPFAGLAEAEVSSFIAALGGPAFNAQMTGAVYRATEGNPLYVDEVVRALLARGAAEGALRIEIPDTVRETISQGLAPLSAGACELLQCAAVLGRDFTAALVADITAAAEPELSTALHEAVLRGVIEPLDPGSYRFRHGLIRDVLYERIPGERRRALHRDAALRLRAIGYSGGATIVHHLIAAMPLVAASEALQCSLEAGRQAVTALAYEEATRHFETALRLSPGREAEISLELVDTLRRADELPPNRQTFEHDATLVQRLVDTEDGRRIFARAVLGFSHVSETGKVDEPMVRLLEDAIKAVGDREDELRVRLLARLAMALYFSPQRERCRALSDRAIEIAKKIGDKGALASALIAYHFAIWGPDSAEERLRVTEMAIALCDEIGETELALEARLWRISDRLELGDVHGAEEERISYARHADQSRLPLHRWHALLIRSCFALLRGELEEAERVSEAALALGLQDGLPTARMFHLAQTFQLRITQERGGEVAPALRELSETFSFMPIWRCCLIRACLQSGARDEADQHYRILARDGFASVPRDGNWLPSLATLAWSAAALDDAAGAAALYALLRPYAGQHVVSVTAIASSGPLSYFLGLLAATMDEPSEARLQLQQAATACERAGYGPLRAAAEQALVRCGEEQLARDQSSIAPQLLREGDYWSVSFRGKEVRVRDSKGLHYLACLLLKPREKVHAAHLQAVCAADDTRAVVATQRSDSGSILDPRAKAAYKRRIADLEDEIEQSVKNNDLGRRARAEEELDFLARELAAATGLGRRDRKVGSLSERARVNVTRTLSATIRAIAMYDKDLAAHLSATVKTGNFCVYDPDAARE